tara:strand:- start:449 stop:871 length:423 start_codon:yes stop_codon:yes gene_type:complete
MNQDLLDTILYDNFNFHRNGWIEEAMKSDDNFMQEYGKACIRAKLKYPNNKQKYRLKILATKSNFAHAYVSRLIYERQKFHNIIIDSIKDYNKRKMDYKQKYGKYYYQYFRFQTFKGENKFYGYGKEFYKKYKKYPYKIK